MVNNPHCIFIQDPPLKIKDNFYFDKFYDHNSCNVSVIWCIYNKGKKNIIDIGESRPCGINHSQSSIHAEEKCIEYCRSADKRKKYELYIWRYSKEGKVKPVYCCQSCCKLLKKFNYYDKIYTFEKNQICCATGQPYVTIGRMIKNNE